MAEVFFQKEVAETVVEVFEDEECWRYELALHQTYVRDYHVLKYLEISHNCYTPIEVQHTNGVCAVQLSKDEKMSPWLTLLETCTLREKLQLCINTTRFSELVTSPCTGLCIPENIFVNIYRQPQLFYRGILHQVAPYTQSPKSILSQRKALVIHTLYPKYSFPYLVSGAFLLTKLPEVAQDLFAATTHEALNGLLQELYDEEDKRINIYPRYVEYFGYFLCFCTVSWFVYFNIVRG